jgi:hypothetical protein
LLTVATNTGNSGICEHMTPAAMEPKVMDAKARHVRPDIAEQLSLQAGCRRQAAGGAHFSYSAEFPTDEQQALRLLAALGVAKPLARDWPISEKANYYLRFLFALWPNEKDPAHQAARDKLVKRLLAQEHPR